MKVLNYEKLNISNFDFTRNRWPRCYTVACNEPVKYRMIKEKRRKKDQNNPTMTEYVCKLCLLRAKLAEHWHPNT